MDMTEKSTSENGEINGDLSVYQKENQKQKGGRKRKMNSEPSHEDFNRYHTDQFHDPRHGYQEIQQYQEESAIIPPHLNHHESMPGNIDHLMYRQERIMNRLYRDQMHVMNPEIVPFQNREHAIDILSSYHIFSQPSYDDLVFNFSPRYDDLPEDVKNVTESIKNTLNEHENLLGQNIVMDLLLTEEQKYIVTKYGEFLKNKKKKAKTTPRPINPKPRSARPSPRMKKEDRLKVKLKFSELKEESNTLVTLKLPFSEK
ncbi:hypothetical protein M153_3160006898 [Pseudoloma neurophilia]|uniref:GLTSCR protein conserved domain-containing protein n=1 Tax=Pseudoloma neurophilia TaxID=146866 RepID=A0A0R0M7C2_9MICR|nr:hypothetical protein M153_3160006898 [Pseudoloma neurophilia]